MTGTNEVKEGFDIILTENKIENDLGVNVDNKLSFRQHIHLSTIKANKVVGMIRPSFDHLTEKT